MGTAFSPNYQSLDAFLTQRKLPEEGWPDNRIEMLLGELSMMDSNNFPGKLNGFHVWAF